jgi:hypothetical protein
MEASYFNGKDPEMWINTFDGIRIKIKLEIKVSFTSKKNALV